MLKKGQTASFRKMSIECGSFVAKQRKVILRQNFALWQTACLKINTCFFFTRFFAILQSVPLTYYFKFTDN